MLDRLKLAPVLLPYAPRPEEGSLEEERIQMEELKRGLMQGALTAMMATNCLFGSC